MTIPNTTRRNYVLKLKPRSSVFEKYEFGKYSYWFSMANKIPIIVVQEKEGVAETP